MHLSFESLACLATLSKTPELSPAKTATGQMFPTLNLITFPRSLHALKTKSIQAQSFWLCTIRHLVMRLLPEPAELAVITAAARKCFARSTRSARQRAFIPMQFFPVTLITISALRARYLSEATI